MQITKGLTIKKKLILTFFLTVVMVGSALYYTIANIRFVDERYTYMVNEYIGRMFMVLEIERNFIEMRGLAAETFFTGYGEQISHDVLVARQNQISELYDRIIYLYNNYLESLHNDTVLPRYTINQQLRIASGFSRDISGSIRIITNNFFVTSANPNPSRNPENLGALIDRVEYEISTLLEICTNGLVVLQGEVDRFVAERRFITITAAIMLGVVLVSMAYALVVSIAKSTDTFSKGVKEVLKGNFDVSMRTDKSDEISLLSNMVADMIDVFKSLLDEIDRMSHDLETGNIDSRIKEDIFEGGYKDVAVSVNETIGTLVGDMQEILDMLVKYSDGDFEANIRKFPGKKALIHESMDSLQLNLKNVSIEMDKLIHAASEGKLSTRADETVYHGNWKMLVEGLNELLDNVEKPIEEAVIVLEEVAQGNLNVTVSGEYQGDFAKIKNSLNRTVTSFSSYIAEISQVLSEMSNKNLDIEITREYMGDFNNIKDSINDIIGTFNVVIDEINVSSGQVAAGATQISESSMELANASTKQANSVEELNLNVNKILEQIQGNAQNADNTSILAQEAKQKADVGNADMKQMLVSMDEINSASKSISKIIKVIDDIAFQTNLLALNAAVEAARAGDHGKGFAVVAEEVRALAQRSKNAAAETNILIETSIQKTNAGSLIANKTAETLNSIVEQVAEISTLIGGVAEASKNQAVAAENISNGISEVSRVTQITTSNSEESASASEELSSQTETFKNLVGKFNLKGHNKKATY